MLKLETGQRSAIRSSLLALVLYMLAGYVLSGLIKIAFPWGYAIRFVLFGLFTYFLVRKFAASDGRLFFLQNNFAVYGDYALVGTKGFTFEGPFYLDRWGNVTVWDEAVVYSHCHGERRFEDSIWGTFHGIRLKTFSLALRGMAGICLDKRA